MATDSSRHEKREKDFVRDPLGIMLARWRTRVVLPHVSGRLLDIGCGSNRLVRAYGTGLGVDVYDWGDVDVLVENAAQLPFPDSSFDTASVIAALNHIPNREEVLMEICRVLRPGGRLITTMIPPGISRIWHNLRRPWDADQHERGMKPGEVYGLTPGQMNSILTACGFVVEISKSFMLGVNRLTVSRKSMAQGALA